MAILVNPNDQGGLGRPPLSGRTSFSSGPPGRFPSGVFFFFFSGPFVYQRSQGIVIHPDAAPHQTITDSTRIQILYFIATFSL